MSNAENRQRWLAAAHAVQSAIAYELSINDNEACTPKHLRTGINIALRDHGSLVDLLIKKGIITEEAYLKAIADGMETEQKELEAKHKVKFG